MDLVRTVALHDTKELHNDLRARADEHLTLSTALRVDNVVQAVILRGQWLAYPGEQC